MNELPSRRDTSRSTKCPLFCWALVWLCKWRWSKAILRGWDWRELNGGSPGQSGGEGKRGEPGVAWGWDPTWGWAGCENPPVVGKTSRQSYLTAFTLKLSVLLWNKCISQIFNKAYSTHTSLELEVIFLLKYSWCAILYATGVQQIHNF